MAAERIRIEDLAKPVLTEAQQQALALGERTEVELAAAFEGRMGSGMAQTLAAKCKAGAIG